MIKVLSAMVERFGSMPLISFLNQNDYGSCSKSAVRHLQILLKLIINSILVAQVEFLSEHVQIGINRHVGILFFDRHLSEVKCQEASRLNVFQTQSDDFVRGAGPA